MPGELDNPRELIKRRRSVRNYDSSRPVETPARNFLQARLEEESNGPLGNRVRFSLLDLGQLDPGALRGLGTYGVIRGASLYLLGAVPDRDGGMEDLGYCMERIILLATSMNLGTCWLAGTFRRGAFSRKMGLQPHELLPAITPLGYPASGRRILDRVMEAGARSRQRKPWSQLFFSSDGVTPLTYAESGDYGDALESVRLAPSASNRQPWRIIQENQDVFHLYLRENRRYNRALGKIRIQNIDMGIAMCHFALVARSQGHQGQWVQLPEAPAFPELQYVATWQPQ